MPHSDGFLHYLTHHFDRTFEIEALALAHVQLQRYGIEVFLAAY